MARRANRTNQSAGYESFGHGLWRISVVEKSTGRIRSVHRSWTPGEAYVAARLLQDHWPSCQVYVRRPARRRAVAA
jgi:hypothetical protein